MLRAIRIEHVRLVGPEHSVALWDRTVAEAAKATAERHRKIGAKVHRGVLEGAHVAAQPFIESREMLWRLYKQAKQNEPGISDREFCARVDTDHPTGIGESRGRIVGLENIRYHLKVAKREKAG